MGTSRTDFEVGLNRDLTAFGVVEADAEGVCPRPASWRCHSLRNGCRQEADKAAEIMNSDGAVGLKRSAHHGKRFRTGRLVSRFPFEILRVKQEEYDSSGPVLACLSGSSFAGKHERE